MKHSANIQVPVKLGPLALLLTVISICVTTLSILTFSTAEADRRLADRYARTVTLRCSLENRGQEFLKDLSEAAGRGDTVFLSGYQTDQAGIYENRIEEDGAVLNIRAAVNGDRVSVLSSKVTHQWEEDTGMDIWNGFDW